MHDELTRVDIKKMQEEIEYRISLKPALRAEVARTRDFGDLSENDEYRSAKREMNKNNSRIRYLEQMIRTAIIIDTEDGGDDTVDLFDTVTIRLDEDGSEEVYRIVTTLRQDVLHGFISKESPMGSALVGKKLHDKVKITVSPTYSYDIEIVKIEKGSDDEDIPISSY